MYPCHRANLKRGEKNLHFSALLEGSLLPSPTALSCDFVGQMEKRGAHPGLQWRWELGGRRAEGPRGTVGPARRWDFTRPIEAAAPCVVQREMSGVVGQQSPLSPTTVTEVLLCARHRARARTGTPVPFPGLMLHSHKVRPAAEPPDTASPHFTLSTGSRKLQL